jgi:hypothetical protein
MERPSKQASCAKLHRDHFSILFISHWSFLSKAPRSHAEIGQKKTNRGRDGGSTIPKRKFAIKMICISFIRESGQIVLVVGLIPIMCPKRKLACRRMVFVHPFMSPCCWSGSNWIWNRIRPDWFGLQPSTHRLNTESDLHGHSCTHLYETLQPHPLFPRIWAHKRGCYWSDKIDADISLWPPVSASLSKKIK